MARLVTRVLGAVATLVFTLVVVLAAVAFHGVDGSGPSPPGGACADPSGAADGSGGRTVALADRTPDVFARVIEAVSDRETADRWRSAFSTCDGPAAFDPDGSSGPS